MNLYLMRHANAGVTRGNPALDAKRSLIAEGKEPREFDGAMVPSASQATAAATRNAENLSGRAVASSRRAGSGATRTGS